MAKKDEVLSDLVAQEHKCPVNERHEGKLCVKKFSIGYVKEGEKCVKLAAGRKLQEAETNVSNKLQHTISSLHAPFLPEPPWYHRPVSRSFVGLILPPHA